MIHVTGCTNIAINILDFFYLPKAESRKYLKNMEIEQKKDFSCSGMTNEIKKWRVTPSMS